MAKKVIIQNNEIVLDNNSASVIDLPNEKKGFAYVEYPFGSYKWNTSITIPVKIDKIPNRIKISTLYSAEYGIQLIDFLFSGNNINAGKYIIISVGTSSTKNGNVTANYVDKSEIDGKMSINGNGNLVISGISYGGYGLRTSTYYRYELYFD